MSGTAQAAAHGDSCIRPTHTCFDDALDYLGWRIQQKPALAQRDTLVLVHAICLVPEWPRKGRPFAHAWVEERLNGEWVAWQDGFLDGERVTYSIHRDELDRMLRPRDTTRYTPRQAWEANNQWETFGPWEPRYINLCCSNPEAFE